MKEPSRWFRVRGVVRGTGVRIAPVVDATSAEDALARFPVLAEAAAEELTPEQFRMEVSSWPRAQLLALDRDNLEGVR
jgi:hypothetical protein